MLGAVGQGFAAVTTDAGAPVSEVEERRPPAYMGVGPWAELSPGVPTCGP
jgi:hypothetical protein